MKLLSWLNESEESGSAPEPEPEPEPSPNLLSRLKELEKISVKDVMVPRPLVVALDAEVQLKRVRRLRSSKSGYFPVYKGDLDHILGWISKPKVIELLNSPGDDTALENFVNPVGTITDTASAAELADAFLKNSCPFLIVKNAHGSTVGIVPLTEFAELLFGFELGAAAPGATESTGGGSRNYEI